MGKAQFFWAFVVALVLFGLAGGMSIKGGIAKVLRPEPLENVTWSYLAIGIGVFFDGLALRLAYRALRERMANEGETSVLRAFRDCTDATVITVLMEDALALAGLVVAAIAIGIAEATGWYAHDGYASNQIGSMLMVFAFLLALELKSMLIGEGLPTRTVERIKAAIVADPLVKSVADVRTLVQRASKARSKVRVSMVDRRANA